MSSSIYLLKDPISNEIRYVGCTKNLKERYKAHINKCRDLNTPKRIWLESLRLQNLKPILEVIEVVENDAYLEKEKYYIKLYREQGCNLTNIGNINYNGNKTSFKIGQNAVKVVCLFLNGTYYNTYKSITDAANNNNTTPSNIHSVLSKITKTAANLIWLYDDIYQDLSTEDIKELIIYSNTKPVNGLNTRFKEGSIAWNKGLNIKLKPNKNVHQYSAKTGDFIKTWETAKQAGGLLNINIDSISNCARNISKSSGGYIWKYIKTESVEPIKYTGKTNNFIINNLK